MQIPHRKSYATITDPDRPLQEWDTCQCGHCQRIIFTKPLTVSTVYLIPQGVGVWQEEPGAGCRMCMRPVCLPCYAKGTCTPWEEQLAQIEAHGRFRRSVCGGGP